MIDPGNARIRTGAPDMPFNMHIFDISHTNREQTND